MTSEWAIHAFEANCTDICPNGEDCVRESSYEWVGLPGCLSNRNSLRLCWGCVVVPMSAWSVVGLVLRLFAL